MGHTDRLVGRYCRRKIDNNFAYWFSHLSADIEESPSFYLLMALLLVTDILIWSQMPFIHVPASVLSVPKMRVHNSFNVIYHCCLLTKMFRG